MASLFMSLLMVGPSAGICKKKHAKKNNVAADQLHKNKIEPKQTWPPEMAKFTFQI